MKITRRTENLRNPQPRDYINLRSPRKHIIFHGGPACFHACTALVTRAKYNSENTPPPANRPGSNRGGSMQYAKAWPPPTQSDIFFNDYGVSETDAPINNQHSPTRREAK